MRLLVAAFAALALAAPAFAASPGMFRSSDPLLNQIWAASVKTATDMVVPGPISLDASGRPCGFSASFVILDGTLRDRCPYIGDLAVEGKTLLETTPSALPVLHNMLLWFAANQHDDGAIPASPYDHGEYVLVDYNAYWIETLYNYVLYTGDAGLAKAVWPQLTRLITQWYASHVGAGGLLVNDLGPRDYAYIRRRGATVAYYNAGYARALSQASQLATWMGDTKDAAEWKARIAPVASAFSTAFWDAGVGAFRDATDGPVVHPQDGNVFAILAGLATKTQAASALQYLSKTTQRPWGDTIADNNVWDVPGVWGDEAGERAYPFISYYDVLARYAAGRDASALELIRREWGYMVRNGPKTTMWESIGPHGSPPPTDFGSPSYEAGWSSGAAPLLTDYVLGVIPFSPGWGKFSAAPHPGDLTWASGDVPIPQGTIHFEWRRLASGWKATVVSPVPGYVTLPGGKPVAVGAGTHVLRA